MTDDINRLNRARSHTDGEYPQVALDYCKDMFLIPFLSLRDEINAAEQIDTQVSSGSKWLFVNDHMFPF